MRGILAASNVAAVDERRLAEAVGTWTSPDEAQQGAAEAWLPREIVHRPEGDV